MNSKGVWSYLWFCYDFIFSVLYLYITLPVYEAEEMLYSHE